MSLKKRIGDRMDTREVIENGEVTATHTEKLIFKPHPAALKSKSERKRERRRKRG